MIKEKITLLIWQGNFYYIQEPHATNDEIFHIFITILKNITKTELQVNKMIL